MNLGAVWGNLSHEERDYIHKCVGAYSWVNLPAEHTMNKFRSEFNRLPFFDLLMVIKAVKLYRLNNTMSYDEMEMMEVVLKKLKGRS